MIHNHLIISAIGGGIESLRRCRVLFLLIICALACACNKPKPADGSPVEIPASIFYNRDSVMHYAELAYRQDDPKGCFVTGACYYLRLQGDLPDYITTVSREEADEFLMLSAGQHYQPALDLIHCLRENGSWKH
ncbi:MAG: hypothetical protein J5761_02615 [Paludibacteraceae bacterium]|nr:hypothetical protein [Paludibacteraceae bacterium]